MIWFLLAMATVVPQTEERHGMFCEAPHALSSDYTATVRECKPATLDKSRKPRKPRKPKVCHPPLKC